MEIYPTNLNAFRKLVLVIYVSEVAVIRMWTQEGCHIAGAHNIAGLAT
jgi:hypothetical protein